jgi:segregation and condensation protein A
MTIAADDVDRVEEVEEAAPSGFAVHLDNFEGPFDLLLQLIARHQLDITDIALSKVTDEFIAHLKAMGDDWELDQTSQFLVIASTLLDLKVVRLLPSADLEDEEDLALLEARDLLFARLMQYRAFKQVAAVFEQRMAAEARRHPRAVGLEERYTAALPDVLITLSLDEFAALAARALEPRPEPVLELAHLHVPRVSVREQAAILVDRLRRHQTMTFRALVADSPDMLTTVGRFLALLELFRENAVAFEQLTPLGDLNIRWTGLGDGEIDIADEYDEYDEHPEAEEADIGAEAEAVQGAAEASGAQSETGDSETTDTQTPDVGAAAAETEDEEIR